jgi:hypothetical protein
LQPFTHHLPAPLNKEKYSLLRQGVADDSELQVWVNAPGDFAFLHPQPSVDYSSYVPRAQKLDLQAYKKSTKIFEQRLSKIGPLIGDARSFMEIGASDGSFLKYIRDQFQGLTFFAVEPDQNTRPQRDVLSWLTCFDETHEATNAGCLVDRVGLFHVFEHLSSPAEMLQAIQSVLSDQGSLIVEVPCLLDPLLSVYQTDAYEQFYFQRQHPYVYSAASLTRVIEAQGFTVAQVIPSQRYGLENHMQWLCAGRPGGNLEFATLFSGVESEYRSAIEASGKTDTIFVEAKVSK